MTPDQFMAALSAHFRANHDSDEIAARWYDDMVFALNGYGSDTLAKTARDIIHERRVKYFPLVAEIREVAERHVQRYRDDDDLSPYRVNRQRVEYISDQERYRLAREWRDQVTASHGSVDQWLKSTVHLRQDGTLGKGIPAKRSSFKSVSDALPVPNRELMESLQDAAVKTPDGYQRHTRQLSERSRRMMGGDE